jgi:hypothetical protein
MLEAKIHINSGAPPHFMAEEPDMPFEIGAVLRRKFKRGNFYHYGIASEYYHPELNLQMIYQFGGPFSGDIENPSLNLRLLNRIWGSGEGNHTGVRVGITDYITFSEGIDIEVIEIPDDPIPVLERAKKMLNREDYNPLIRNCEHYANYALTGDWKSSQASLSVKQVGKGLGMILGGLFSKR